MQFPESWLRSMVNPPLGVAELTERLTMAGLEVESCDPVAPAFDGVVVAEVLAVEKHPNADRLHLCQVRIAEGGADEALKTIVCGAPNVRPGLKVPCALPGATLPGGLQIAAAKVRGVQSHGMLCSARELGLSEDHAGLLELAAEAPVGHDFRAYFALDDHRITIKLTPNRPDCLSVLGVAREVSTLTGVPLEAPACTPVPPRTDRRWPVRITSPQGCGRFTGRVITHVNAAAPTPEWMKQRLERAGQRPISALVDVTNYVMLELGRPLHVYDLDRLQGEIDVRFGRPGESLTLLNGQTVALDADVLCIADARGPIGLAGIMGGESTKAETTTRHVFLEAAFFFPEAIAGRARRFNFSSDASHRFERGVDFDNNLAGIERATRLILDICGGEPGPTVDTQVAAPERPPVLMRVPRACRVIGVPIPGAEMAALLAGLGLSPELSGSGASETIRIRPPSFRFDLAIEEDVIEEVARLYGFDRIPANAPHAPAQMRPVPERSRSLHALRERMVAGGYREVINFSFVDEASERDLGSPERSIRVLNPIAAQHALMRTSLMGGLVANLRYNLNRGATRVRVFEIGRAFLRDPAVGEGPLAVAGIDQPMRVAGLAWGPVDEEIWANPKRGVDFFDAKGDLEALCDPLPLRLTPAQHPALHPGRCARVELEGRPIGWIGELHPRWVQAQELASPPVLFELDAEPLLARPFPRFAEVSRFPVMVRDLALVFDEAVPYQAVLDAVRAWQPPAVTSLSVFDLYRGKGIPETRKSLAFRVVMQDTGRTLTDAEADALGQEMVALLREKFGAELR